MSRRIGIVAAVTLVLCSGCQSGGWGMTTPSTNWFSGWKNPWKSGADSSAVALSQGKTPSATQSPSLANSIVSNNTATIPPNPAANAAATWPSGNGYPATASAAISSPAVVQSSPYQAQPATNYGTQPAGYNQQVSPSGYQTGQYQTSVPAGGYEAAANGTYGSGNAAMNYPTNTGGYQGGAPSYEAQPAYQPQPQQPYQAQPYQQPASGYGTGGGYQGGGAYQPADPGYGASAAPPMNGPPAGRYGAQEPIDSQYPVRPVAAEAPVEAAPVMANPSAMNPASPPAEANSAPAPSLLQGRGTLPANLNAEGGYRPGSTGGRVWR